MCIFNNQQYSLAFLPHSVCVKILLICVFCLVLMHIKKIFTICTESWRALRRRFELQAFRMVAKIRGFFDPCSIIYLGKFPLEFMKIKNINWHSLKIQISSPTVFTMRMRKFNFGAQPDNGCCLHRAKIHANTWVQYIMTKRYDFI